MAKYNAPAGCCVTKGGLKEIAPVINVACTAQGTALSGSDSPEAYLLNVTEDGISITARSDAGAALAMRTLGQLLRFDPVLNASVVDRLPVHIADAPHFPWRGLMLDTSRHFIGVDAIKALLRGMHAAKLNVFHWHIVDSPSFPYESRAFPDLAREGAYGGAAASPRNTYSQADVADIFSYASDRFIQVAMEFDTPAHTMSWGHSRPDIMTDCWQWLAQESPKVDVDSQDCMALDPTNPDAARVARGLLEEVAALAGSDHPYLHLGGDEVKSGGWLWGACQDAEATERTWLASFWGGSFFLRSRLRSSRPPACSFALTRSLAVLWLSLARPLRSARPPSHCR
jgi:hexosaminidase